MMSAKDMNVSLKNIKRNRGFDMATEIEKYIKIFSELREKCTQGCSQREADRIIDYGKGQLIIEVRTSSECIDHLEDGN